MTIGKAISIAIDRSILDRIDQLQPSHFTRKAFVNQLLFEAVEQRFRSLTVTELNALKSQAE
jgi:hypothetical protein